MSSLEGQRGTHSTRDLFRRLSHGEHCDEAIAELFYACNIPAAVADHHKFKKVVKALRAAPSSYKPPDRHKLHGALLDSTVQSLRPPMISLMNKNCSWTLRRS